MLTPTLLTLALLQAAPAPRPAGALPRLVVLELTPGGGLDPSLAAPLTEAVTGEVQARGYFEVVSTRDVNSLLGLERQKQLLGCADEAAASCVAELSGALGARFVMAGTLARLGEAYQLTISTLDSQRAQPIGRSTRVSRSLEDLRRSLPYVVAEATATPRPPPPSKAVPYTLLGLGAAAGVVGVVFGGLSLGEAQQLTARLDSGTTSTGVLGTKAETQQRAQQLQTQGAWAAGALAAGLALATAGVLLLPPEPGGGLALAPMPNGLLVAGVWP